MTTAEEVHGDERARDTAARFGRRLTLLLITVEAGWLSAVGYGLAELLS